jgi:hypothetical protein
MYNPNFKQKYLEMESPENIVEELGSGKGFRNWLRTFGVHELQEKLLAFEQTNNLWLECRTIANVIQEKVNSITVTHYTKL